jgi:hypothetical protein
MKQDEKSESSSTHARESSFLSLLSGWVQQGVENVFATQRILVDLVMRKNASAVDVIRGRLAEPDFRPVAIFKEFAVEGLSNFIDGQRLLLDLARQENEILATAFRERAGGFAVTNALVDGLRRSVDNFVDMQEDYLKSASKQVHGRLAAVRAGSEYDGDTLIDLARLGLENFVEAQKKFLDVIAQETSKATHYKEAVTSKAKKTELTELARQAADSFIDAQKKLMDVAGRQVHVSLKAAGQAVELIPPVPYDAIPDLTREGVQSFVDAEKAVIDSITSRRTEPKLPAKKGRRVVKRGKRTAKSAAVVA